jgi:hypothetical protein
MHTFDAHESSTRIIEVHEAKGFEGIPQSGIVDSVGLARRILERVAR